MVKHSSDLGFLGFLSKPFLCIFRKVQFIYWPLPGPWGVWRYMYLSGGGGGPLPDPQGVWRYMYGTAYIPTYSCPPISWRMLCASAWSLWCIARIFQLLGSWARKISPPSTEHGSRSFAVRRAVDFWSVRQQLCVRSNQTSARMRWQMRWMPWASPWLCVSIRRMPPPWGKKYVFE